MKKTFTLLLPLLICLQTALSADVKFQVSGLQIEKNATVTLGSESFLSTQKISKDGEYSFTAIPEGSYFIKIEASGYSLPNAQKIIVDNSGKVAPAGVLQLVITPTPNDENHWKHSWSEDMSTSGYITTSHINTPPTIEFLGKKIVPADVPSIGILHSNYRIILSNEQETWTQEYAYRLLETLKTIPQRLEELKPTKLILTSESLYEDISITDLGGGYEVKISRDAFVYANPFLVNLDGIRGRFFSKRLHHALINYVTDNGRNESATNHILLERFGCTTDVPDYEALTKGITDEDAARFQKFVPSELVSIINMLEELPEGFHKTPHLNYLLRRQNGHKHPLYPEAAAVAWPVDNGYIEFMEASFGGDNNGFETLRLILHEKTHFLWAFTFSDEIKNDWIELGGWYEDPNAADGWSTTKDTEFVSAYAHAKNPNEDMAESVAHYLKNPELLQSRSTGKYEFIRDRIMHGTRYISKIPDHLTFEVLNLNPDYDYPGKIKRLNVTVEGASGEDKLVTVEIELNHMEGFQDGASGGSTRLTSPIFYDENGKQMTQFYDMGFAPVDGNPHLLRGTVVIGKYSKTGYWTAGDIIINDEQGNQRFEGRNDCVWNMYVDNSLEDLEAAKYISGSLNYELSDTIIEGHQAQDLKITCKITDNIGLRDNQSVRIRLQRGTDSYTWDDKYGEYDPETQIATIHFPITEYFPSGDYYVTSIAIYDKGQNVTDILFSESPQDEPVQKIAITTTNPDNAAPEVDLNRLVVYAEPTNKEAPDGETLVTIHYYARDDKSGLGKVEYKLKDPQGIEHREYHYHKNFHNVYFTGDPTVWQRYTISCVLPKGSAPGIWGLSELSASDKVWNNHTYNFVETLIFEPDDSNTDYALFYEMTEDNTKVNLQLESSVATIFGFAYRVINEDTGEEINGEVDTNPRRAKSSSVQTATVDISSLKDGKLIIITQIKDENNAVIAVRSVKVNKDTATGMQNQASTKPVVYAQNSSVFIQAPIGSTVKAISCQGYTLFTTKTTEATTRISHLPSGPCIILVNHTAYKVYIHK